MWVLPLIPIFGQLERIDFAAAAAIAWAPFVRLTTSLRPHRVAVDEIAPHDQMRHALESGGVGLRGSGAPEGSRAMSALTLSGALSAAVEAEIAALAVHDDHARATFPPAHRRPPASPRHWSPSRDALLRELIERRDRELLAFERLALAADLVARPDAEQLPRFFLERKSGPLL